MDLLSRALSFLDVVGSLQAADQGGVGLLALLLAQTWALDAFHLGFRVASGPLLQGGQRQLDSGWRDDGVLVILFLFGLFVQLGGQMAVGLFQGLQKLEVRLALLLSAVSLLLLLFLLLSQQAGQTALLFALLLEVVFVLLIIVILALTVPASILLLLEWVVVHVAVVAAVFIVFVELLTVAVEALLVLHSLDHLVETAFAVVWAS